MTVLTPPSHPKNVVKFAKPKHKYNRKKTAQTLIGLGLTKTAPKKQKHGAASEKTIGMGQVHWFPGTIKSQPVQKRPLFIWLSRSKTLVRRILNIAMLVLLLIGAGTLWDATVGDGPLPQLSNLKQISPHQVELAQGNSTAHIPLTVAQAHYWENLSASRSLLLSLSPQIAYWLFNLHQQGHIVPHTPDDIHRTYHVSADTPMLAAYRYNEDKLYLGEEFWKLSDGQKVAVIAHEYRHSRQNFGKRISYQLAQWLGLGQLSTQTPMESEAMDYERQAATALGIQ